jgi:hypothetical protein
MIFYVNNGISIGLNKTICKAAKNNNKIIASVNPSISHLQLNKVIM